jgi:DNA-binding SARP family transcriptional activator
MSGLKLYLLGPPRVELDEAPVDLQRRKALALLIYLAISGQGSPEAAILHARRWLALDPLHEPAQRQLMQLFDQAGQPAAALRQYEEYVKLLEEELGCRQKKKLPLYMKQ